MASMGVGNAMHTTSASWDIELGFLSASYVRVSYISLIHSAAQQTRRGVTY